MKLPPLLSSLFCLLGCVGAQDVRPSPGAAPYVVTARFREPVWVGRYYAAVAGIQEDSRCPANVACIQAGTVRLSVVATFEDGPQREVELELGTPRELGGQWLTLTEVCPLPGPVRLPQLAEFRFHIVVANTAEAAAAHRAAIVC